MPKPKRKDPEPTIDVSDRFEQIANEAIAEAERVPCPISEFRKGLQSMIMTLQDRLDCES